MSLTDTNQLFEQLRASRLLDDARLEELRALPDMEWADVETAARRLVELGAVTPLQIQEIRAGRGHRLVVGGYRLVEQLATTHGRDTFKALHPALQQPVSLTFIAPEWLAPLDTVDEYVNRTQAACLVSHTHLANLLDAGLHEGVPFVVQEFVDGCAIGRLVKEMGALPVSLVCTYGRQAALALQEAASKNIVHGHVSPQTVLLTPVKRMLHEGSESVRPRAGAAVKLADLGIAPRRPALSAWLPEDASDLEYQPPEAVLGETPTAIGDVYSLGATLYFLLAGRPPFMGTSAAEVVQQLAHAQPVAIEYLRTDVPITISSLIGRLLNPVPMARPSLAEVIETLAPHAEFAVAAATPPLAVAVASETMSVPNIPTAMPVSEQLVPAVEPLPEIQPLEEHTDDWHAAHIPGSPQGQEDHFDHTSLGADTPAAPRPKKPVTKSNKIWIVMGLCLHLLATLMCLSFLNILPNPFAPSPPEPKQEQKPEPKPKKKANNKARD